MRVRSRLVLGFCGLAMAAPGASPATAAPQDGQPYAPAPAAVTPSPGGAPVIMLQQSTDAPPPAAVMPPGIAGTQPTMPVPPNGANDAPGFAAAPAAGQAAHHHHGLLGRRHCVECQRARAKAADGVDVPPPPGYPGGAPMAAGETVVSGPVIVSERVLTPSEANAAGYAVVGGPESAPGYAVVNGGAAGAEPTPIGVARGGMNAPVDPRMAAAMPRRGAGSYDPAVMPTSVPPPPAAMSGPGHDRPHIISHIFGLPKLGALHQKQVDKDRAHHAAIAYGDPNQKLNELPASVVYSQK